MFIKLTEYLSNNPMHVAITSIAGLVQVRDENGAPHTELFIVGFPDMTFDVIETPEQITEMMENARN